MSPLVWYWRIYLGSTRCRFGLKVPSWRIWRPEGEALEEVRRVRVRRPLSESMLGYLNPSQRANTRAWSIEERQVQVSA